MNRRIAGACMVLAGALAACPRPPKPGDPLRGLSSAERAQFDSGRVGFEHVFTQQTGVGPLFNASACAECHEAPVSGGAGDEDERHAALFNPADTLRQCDELAALGGPVYQDSVTPLLRAALAIDREPLPPGVTVVAVRSTPDVLGFGLLDAVPDSAILALADPDDRNGDGISGRPNRFFDGRLGRFGRKALVPALREFNDGAYQIEQGITNPSVPAEGTVAGRPLPAGTDPAADPELPARDLAVTSVFVQLLAPPTPLKMSGTAREGRDLFERIGCAGCHIPTLRTGNSPIAALRDKEVAAFTDLLLHDMGPENADICFGLATPSEFRTEPLMGLRLSTRFMHDGLAATPDAAIARHGGEGSKARDLFQQLAPTEKAALLAFLKTL
jgi:CxxC motif-containing protein (DUF1111 family)